MIYEGRQSGEDLRGVGDGGGDAAVRRMWRWCVEEVASSMVAGSGWRQDDVEDGGGLAKVRQCQRRQSVLSAVAKCGSGEVWRWQDRVVI